MKNRMFLCLLAAGLLVACGDDTDKNSTSNNTTANNTTANNTTANNTSAGPTVSAVTYNAGLAVGFVTLAAERKDPVAAALATLDADYVCLQEVWLTQDGMGGWTQDNIDTILAATAETYPHNYYAITNTQGGGGAACTEEESAPLVMCVEENCAGVPAGDLAGCVTGNCGAEFSGTSSDCQGCLVGQLGNEFEDIQAACVGGDGGGNSYFSDGHNGLLLLSKHPLTNTSETTYPAVQVSRSLLKATSEHPDFGAVDLYCTHLTAAIGGVDYPADGSMFASYEEEQANQISEILTDVGSATNPVILMGDMNTGPAFGDVDAELPNNWATFDASGLFFPAIDESNPFCTYCADNTLTNSTDSVYIDHIMTSWEPTVVQAMRIFDETEMIAGEANNLSDHYGVMVEIGRAE